MPIFARATDSTQIECEHCSFTFSPPDAASAAVVRCPRCWRPVSASQPAEPPAVVFQPVDSDTAEIAAWTSDTAIKSNDVLEELVQSLESTPQAEPDEIEITDEELAQLTAAELEAVGFGHLATAVEPEVPPPKPAVRPQRKPTPPARQEEPETETVSLPQQIKRALASYSISLLFHLLLMFLAALLVYQTQDVRWHGEIDGAAESIGDGGGLELQTPVQFEAPLPSVDAPRTDTTVSGNFGQGFGESQGKGGIGFFGTRARGKSFAFVVDISGSMTSALPQPPSRDRRRREKEEAPVSRWQKAREEMLQAIDAMTENQSFAVMLYNDSYVPFVRDGRPAGMMRATQHNKDDVRAWLNQINAAGGTEPELSLHEALKLEPEVVFFLTDGIIPAATRETAKRSNISETVIHTTCIGAPENTILQLIANDHGGRFRSVGGSEFDVGHEGVTLVCFVSSETSNRLKFKDIEEDLERFRDKLGDARSVLHDDNSHSMLVFHNAVSDLPKFTLEIQRLIKELNSRTRAGFDTPVNSGLLGINVPLDDLELRFSTRSIEATAGQTMLIRELLETAVSPENTTSSQAVNAIYVFGDLNAKQEVLAGLEVYNLYNGSIIRLVDGEEFLRMQR